MLRETVSDPASERLERRILDSIAAALKSKAEKFVCPVHGRKGDITVHGPTSRRSFGVEGCCDALVDQIHATTGGQRW